MTPTGPDFPAPPGGHAIGSGHGLPRRGIVLHDAGRARAAAPGRPWADDDLVEHALAAAVKDGERISEFLDVLSRGRLVAAAAHRRRAGDRRLGHSASHRHLPGGRVRARVLRSAGRLAHCGYGPAAEGGERPEAGWSVLNGQRAGWMATRVPSAVRCRAGLSRTSWCPRPNWPGGCRLASGSRSTRARRPACPIYPEGVRYLAAAEWRAGEARIRLGQPPVEPESLLREVSAGLRPIPAARQAARAWLSVPGAGEGPIIAVTLDDPADRESQEAVLAAVEQAAVTATWRGSRST